MNRILVFALFVLCSACDKIEAPYGNGSNSPIPTDSAVRKILIEDFTGHTCQACPNAHREATRLHSLFGEQVVVMAVHADFWANPYPVGAPYYTYDFRTSLATQIATDFGVIGQPFPKGLINRMNNPATGQPWVLDWGAWEDRISDWLSQPADAKISITPTYNPSTRAVTADVDVLAVSDMTDGCQLAVYFVEDSIINWQKDQTASPSDVQNYEHNHVLRGSLNGTYGENLGALTAGSNINRNYSGTLIPSDAVAGRVKLIAILSNTVTREIIQVEEVDLVE
jgi:hypothetical protein